MDDNLSEVNDNFWPSVNAVLILIFYNTVPGTWSLMIYNGHLNNKLLIVQSAGMKPVTGHLLAVASQKLQTFIGENSWAYDMV